MPVLSLNHFHKTLTRPLIIPTETRSSAATGSHGNTESHLGRGCGFNVKPNPGIRNVEYN